MTPTIATATDAEVGEEEKAAVAHPPHSPLKAMLGQKSPRVIPPKPRTTPAIESPFTEVPGQAGQATGMAAPPAERLKLGEAAKLLKDAASVAHEECRLLSEALSPITLPADLAPAALGMPSPLAAQDSAPLADELRGTINIVRLLAFNLATIRARIAV